MGLLADAIQGDKSPRPPPSMRDLYEAIKAQEAASLGVTAEQYEALSPVLDAVQGLLAPGAHACLIEQPAAV
jgi:hypothetical protein